MRLSGGAMVTEKKSLRFENTVSAPLVSKDNHF
jgi:hypothetical protein